MLISNDILSSGPISIVVAAISSARFHIKNIFISVLSLKKSFGGETSFLLILSFFNDLISNHPSLAGDLLAIFKGSDCKLGQGKILLITDFEFKIM